MPRKIDSKTYIIIAIKKLYLMFLKYKQTQLVCEKWASDNLLIIIPEFVFVLEIKHRKNRHSTFILVVLFIIVQ